MAGHSKWANIQHRKGAQDKRRAKLFTKLIRELTVAGRQGADPAAIPVSASRWTAPVPPACPATPSSGR